MCLPSKKDLIYKMTFVSPDYLLFVFGACLGYYIMPPKIRWLVLLAASLLFYYISGGFLIICILASSVSVYLGAARLDRLNTELAEELSTAVSEKKKIRAGYKRKKRLVMMTVLGLNLGLLCFFKYLGGLDQIFSSMSGILAGSSFSISNMTAPLGISFYTLQAVGYLADVYWDKYRSERNIFRLMLFVCFFPQIAEGPIGRYNIIANQLFAPNKLSVKNIGTGSRLILWGFFQKLVIANRIGLITSEIFSNHENYSGFIILMCAALYSFQIYADFAGCIDIVRGTARLFGIGLQKNFDAPFFAKSINEFWQRWHITLGAWLRDYIFYPVSRSKFCGWLSDRSQLLSAAFALFFVWLGNGIWHGAGIKFIFYGMYYFAFMLIGMIFEPIFSRFSFRENIIYKSFQVLRTVAIVFGGMLIFGSRSLSSAFSMMASIFQKTNGSFAGLMPSVQLAPSDAVIIGVCAVMVIILDICRLRNVSVGGWLNRRGVFTRWAIYTAIMISVVVFGIYGSGYNASDFIYGAF